MVRRYRKRRFGRTPRQRVPRHMSVPVDLMEIQKQAREAGLRCELRRLPGHGAQDDTAEIVFRRGPWTILAYFPGNGRAYPGGVRSGIPTVAGSLQAALRLALGAAGVAAGRCDD